MHFENFESNKDEVSREVYIRLRAPTDRDVLFFLRTFGDNDLVRFLCTIRTMLREVETEVPNIMQDRERCEFYTNRILCALYIWYSSMSI